MNKFILQQQVMLKDKGIRYQFKKQRILQFVKVIVQEMAFVKYY